MKHTSPPPAENMRRLLSERDEAYLRRVKVSDQAATTTDKILDDLDRTLEQTVATLSSKRLSA